MCVHMNAGSYIDERKALDSPQLELQGIRNCLIWVLGREPGSSGRAVHVPHRWATSPVPHSSLWSDMTDLKIDKVTMLPISLDSLLESSKHTCAHVCISIFSLMASYGIVWWAPSPMFPVRRLPFVFFFSPWLSYLDDQLQDFFNGNMRIDLLPLTNGNIYEQWDKASPQPHQCPDNCILYICFDRV